MLVLQRNWGMNLQFSFGMRDSTCSEHTLASLYPNLFAIAIDPELLVIEAFKNIYLHISFARQLNEWYNMHTHLLDFHPNPYLNDTLLWRWSTMGKFSVHSNYV